jgi:hypothetical protein
VVDDSLSATGGGRFGMVLVRKDLDGWQLVLRWRGSCRKQMMADDGLAVGQVGSGWREMAPCL